MKKTVTGIAGKFNQLRRQVCAILMAAVALVGVTSITNVAHAAPAAGTSIGNQASATYIDSSLTTRNVTSNTVTTIVQQVASLTLTANNARNAAANSQVNFPHTLTNTGNGTDTFALSTGNSGAFSF